MKNFLIIFVLFLLLSSCSQDIYRVVKYSDYNTEEESFREYNEIDNQYYVIRNSHYYYMLNSDSIIHYKKLSYVGKVDGYDRTLVVLDNGKRLFLDATLDNGYYNDQYVYVNVVDYYSKEMLYRFVLDWDDKVDEELLKNKLEKID